MIVDSTYSKKATTTKQPRQQHFPAGWTRRRLQKSAQQTTTTKLKLYGFIYCASSSLFSSSVFVAKTHEIFNMFETMKCNHKNNKN